MRHFDIPYVKNGPANYYPAKDLQEMTLDEIKKKYIKMCAKANGNISVCSQCKTPCAEGKRAIQLLANEVYNDPPIPLYGGKTLIEKAREENMKRKEEKKVEKVNMYREGWYEEASASDDIVGWVMREFGIDRRKAKKKIYMYRYHHRDKDEKPNIEDVKEMKKDYPQESKSENQTGVECFETKLEKLLALQEEQKKLMEKYKIMYEQAQEEYNKIKHKTDILCSAMDILND